MYPHHMLLVIPAVSTTIASSINLKSPHAVTAPEHNHHVLDAFQAQEEHSAGDKPFLKPTWPTEFYAAFTEDTWYQNQQQSERGWMLYSYAHGTQAIYRPVSKFNPICDRVKPGDETPCIHHSTDGASRFLIWPNTRECCLYCQEGCGTLNPQWVTAAPFHYAGIRNYNGVACDEWVIESSTPDRVAFSQKTGALCELYDGGASFTGDNPFQITIDPNTYTKEIEPNMLQLPSYCFPVKKCARR
ncbi:hypothetical protein SARC_01859 [Sphaeroforma arctica JP610]|uniref:Uncharacterized protein n=1 Tax=Sphaeroforma arctica JP610 TaxID=667725 RepID=A0A0L0GCJ7_9EUKA|nr:hypothetical protein SARC_01859 [Sphaeroforma arctica JP610]KNC85983.1 hypothetical protein SARC_01859 [Sphaeroforma arctica JP610]|eukprot:XP_014159885.1 hypothetical protein SARC_01859 [Sphaeroforma arctica JP610]